MSGISKIDPRARRTRDVLRDALVALIQEKTFDSITVQDLLDRADVSRSTFYTHYADKQEVRELGIGYFARSIELRLRSAEKPIFEGELRLVANGLAGALFSLMDHWLVSRKRLTPREIDAVFHRLVP